MFRLRNIPRPDALRGTSLTVGAICAIFRAAPLILGHIRKYAYYKSY
jgi:hypothetical protein